MAELGYIPNRLAKNLATGSTRTVGLIITSLQSPFFARATEGIQDVLADKGYHLVLCNTKFNTQIELDNLRLLQEGLLDGIITTAGNQTHEVMVGLARQNYPIVFINHIYEELKNEANRVGYVQADLAYSGRTVGRYLLELGHRQIGLLYGDHNSTANILRLEGLRVALQAQGVGLKPELMRTVAYPHESIKSYNRSEGTWAYSETLELLQAHPEITALLVFYHPMLPGVIQALRDAGRSVPDSVSLVGFDDFPLAPYLDPPLTVMTQPVYEMGRAAARLLVQKIEDKRSQVAEPIVLKPELIIRRSCAPAPIRRQPIML
jgi:LacI family transcriptional regulator